MIRFILLFLFVFINISKTTAQDIFDVSEAEAKSAASKVHFRVNPNT